MFVAAIVSVAPMLFIPTLKPLLPYGIALIGLDIYGELTR